jgi:HEAT repeat protein
VFAAAAAWCASSSIGQRRLGAEVLGELGFEDDFPFAREAEPVLLRLLVDTEPTVVAEALLALGTLGADNTIAICRLVAHPVVEVRAALARCLCDLAGPRVVPTLIRLTRDRDARVRRTATSGLCGLDREDTPDLREALVERLGDTDAETREEAIFALAQLDDDRVDDALRAACEEPETSELIEMARMQVESRRDLDPRRPHWPPRPN